MDGVGRSRGAGWALWALLGLLALAALALASAPAQAGGTGDWPPPATGNWVVNSPTTVDNETITVNGTLYVSGTTTMLLDNVTLRVNSNSANTYGIYIYAPSTLLVYNSVLTTLNTNYRFYFYNYGTLQVEGSDVSHLSTYGIYSRTGNLVLRNNEIHDGSYSGVYVYLTSSQPTVILEGNTLYDLDYYAMVLYYYSYFSASGGFHELAGDFVVRDNIIRDNIGGGIYVYRYLYDYLNDGSSLRANLTVEGNQFLRNRGYGLFVYNYIWNNQGGTGADSSFDGRIMVTNNRFEENSAYYAVYLRNLVTMSFSGGTRVDVDVFFNGNTIVNNSGSGVYLDFVNTVDHSSGGDVVNNGEMWFQDNQVTGNQGYGIYIYRYAYAQLARSALVNGRITLINNTIVDNLDSGMYVFNYAYAVDGHSALIDGPVRIERNTASGNSGYGIYTYNYAWKYQGNQNGTAEIRGDLSVKWNEVAANLAGPAIYVYRNANSNTGSTSYLGGDIDLSFNHVHNNSGNGIGILFQSTKNLGKATGLCVIDSNLTLQGNWVANNSLYIGVSIERTAYTTYSSASRVTGWTRILGNLIEGHDVNGLYLEQNALNYYGATGAESVLDGDVIFRDNVIRNNNLAAAYLYFYSYSYYSTSSRVIANLTAENNTLQDNQAVGLYAYFYALSATAVTGDTVCVNNVLIRNNQFLRNKGFGLQVYRISAASNTPGNAVDLLGDIVVEDNVADANLGTGIWVYSSASNTNGDTGARSRMAGDWTARRNTVTGNLGSYGMAIYSNTYAGEVENASQESSVLIEDNDIRQNAAYGLYVGWSGTQEYFKSASDRGRYVQTGNMVVRNNRFDANSQYGLYAAYSVNSHNVITDAAPVFENNSVSGNTGYYAMYLNMADVERTITIRDNEVSSNEGTGTIQVSNGGEATGLTFTGNSLNQNRETAFGVRISFSGASYALTLEDNTASGNDIRGPLFQIGNNGASTIERNTVMGSINTTAAFDLDASGSSSSSVTFADNSVTNSAGAGLLAITEGSFDVEDNVVSGNGGDGLSVRTLGDWLTSTADITFTRNRATGNGGNGLFSYATNRLSITDNNATGNNLAGLRVNYLALDPTIAGNDLDGNRFGLVLSGNGTSALTASHPISNLSIRSSLLAGLMVEDAAVALWNSTVDSASGVDLSVRQGRIDAYGSQVGYISGEVRASGEIHVWWNLSFRVIWQNGAPVPEAHILMNGSTGDAYGERVADAGGRVAPFRADEWSMVDANVYPWSPYTFTGVKNGETGTNTTALDRDKEVWITIRDIHAPTLSVDFPVEGGLYNFSVVPWRGNVSDLGSGLAVLEVRSDGNLLTSTATPTTPFAGQPSPLADGNHTYSFRAVDVAGVATTLTVNFTVDTTPPVLVILQPTRALVNTSLITVRVQTSPDAVRAVIAFDDVTIGPGAVFESVVRIFEGDNVIRVRAKDRAGNENVTTLAIVLDTTPPAIAVEEPEDGAYTNVEVIRVFGTTEPGALVLVAGQAADVTAGGAFEGAAQLADGLNILPVAAQDGAGNWAFLAVRVTLDQVPPTLTVTSPEDGLITREDFVSVEGEAEEGAQVFVNGKGGQPLGVFQETVHLEEGDNTIVVLARDRAGNTARVERHVTKDTTIPFIDITEPAGGHGFTNDSQYTIRGRTEPSSRIQGAGVSAQADLDGVFALAVNLTQDETVVVLQVWDRINNSNSTAVTISHDATPPTLILYAPADGSTYQVGAAEIVGTTDFGALLTINGAPVQVAVDGSFRWVVPLEEGTNVVVVRAKDKAGNTAEATLTLYLGSTVGSGEPPDSTSTGGRGPNGSRAPTTSDGGGGDLMMLLLLIGVGALVALALWSRGGLQRQGQSLEDEFEGRGQ